MRLYPLAVFFALVAPVLPQAAAARAAAPSYQKLPTEMLRISTHHGSRSYRVEVATTPEQQERGLMFRPSLPKHGGMIFPMSPEREATFWMKNTLIPLDMVFIRKDGTIARIAANCTPYSLAIVDSGEPVAAVLELAGGAAAAAGIDEGDKVTTPSLNPSH